MKTLRLIDICDVPNITEDLPDEVRSKITVTAVHTLAEALAVTLRDTTLRDGRLLFQPLYGGAAGQPPLTH